MKNQTMQQFAPSSLKNGYLKLAFSILFLFLVISACKKDKPSGSPSQPIAINGIPGSPITINGNSYPTVKIGTQVWTTINYNGPGGIDATTPNDPKYGKLYTIDEAKTAATSLTDGYRLPTQNDFLKLFQSQGGKHITGESGSDIQGDNVKRLMATDGWETPGTGTNTSGFNAYPDSPMTPTYANFWTTTPVDGTISQLFYARVYYNIEGTNGTVKGQKGYFVAGDPDNKLSIRFVKDVQ